MRRSLRTATSTILLTILISSIASFDRAAAQAIVLHCLSANNGGSFDLDVSESRVLLDGKRLLSPKQPMSDKDIVDISRDYISFSKSYTMSANDESYLLNRKTKELTYTHNYDANGCSILSMRDCRRDMKEEVKKASCTED